MKKKCINRIGIDIGGTNTDGVIIDENKKIITSYKTPTSNDLISGVKTVLTQLFGQSQILPENIAGIFIGTTQATNAILQARNVSRVGVIRLAGHNPETLLPCYNWPHFLRENVLAGFVTLDGGFECDGREITLCDKDKLLYATKKLYDLGAESLAITGVFSPLNPAQELWAQDIIEREYGKKFPITLSHIIGTVGFLERENAAILNATLINTMSQAFSFMQEACALFTSAPVFVTQNNGTLMTLEQACKYPVLTIAAGPTNSFIGGARLAGLTDAIIVDIGGTSTDIGLVKNGFARRSMHNASVGDVTLNFPMPDVLSIALGGGSEIVCDNNSVSIGPKSCARDLITQSQIFGGPLLTLTDCAVKAGNLEIPGALLDRISVDKKQSQKIIMQARESIEKLITRMAGQYKDLPVVFVGGGAALFNKNLLYDRCVIPNYFDVANAYGAACSRVAATIDAVVCLDERDRILEKLSAQVCADVVAKGVNGSVSIVQKEIIPYFYVPGNKARVIVTAAGEFGFTSGEVLDKFAKV